MQPEHYNYMSSRLFFTIPLAFTATLLHAGCCLLPLFSLASTSLPYLDFFVRYKLFFAWFQLAVMFYLIVKIILDHQKIKPFCNVKDRVIHFVSLLIVITGMLVSYYEPFKNEDQKLAEEQFMFFKNHRQLEINLFGEYDEEVLRKDLESMKGIKSNRILIGNDKLALTFQSNEVSSQEILRNLRLKGYNFAE